MFGTNSMVYAARSLREIGIVDAIGYLKMYRRLRSTLAERIQPLRRHAGKSKPGLGSEKYLDTDFYALVNLLRTFLLGLHRNKRRLRILDLGTGMGYFPFICSLYGHEAAGLDVDTTDLYNESVEMLGITRFTQALHAGQPMRVPGKWDLITAFMICFNGHKTEHLWGVAEWRRFLHNVKKHNLTEGGSIYLSFNAESEDVPIDPELVAYFTSRGASKRGMAITIGPAYEFEK